MSEVKRRYDSGGRKRQAEQTRAAVLDAAQRLFLANGYAGTAIADVATAAGVSVETVYKRFRGKAGLVRALRERALAGVGPVHAEQRSDTLRGEDPHTLVRGWGMLAAEVAPLVAPILLLVRDGAVHDQDLARLRDELDDDRFSRMKDNARALHDRGHLRPGVSLEEAAEVLWTYTAPELFELLVLRRGWSAGRFGAFVADSLASALLALAPRT
ncbi:TetR/AcrR family transcriptional regulator [Lentzea kentuckyensis]|uniref:TetR/AcrR family transcriptional regulator n=1 Tax=Lentzea kentuckyensis TaxID=360086 RepID=UPI000A39B200|nr:TetR family transcriptional regulator [Lentzea kentuckyensis]